MKRFLNMLKSGILTVLTVALVLSFASCKSDLDKEYERELSILLHEKQRLNNEKEKILLGIENELGTPAFMSLLFTELDEAIYTEAFPMMSAQDADDVDIVGVLALSEDELPGLPGKITASEYNTLVSAGWGNALYWHGDGDLREFVSDMQSALESLGIQTPKSIIFANGTYSTDFDALLLTLGIENAIHSGEDGLAYVDGTQPDGVWHPGRIGWRCIGTSTKLKETVEAHGGYALFEIGFDNSAQKYETSFFPVAGDDTDADRVERFYNMISAFKASVKNGKIAVGNIDGVRELTEAHYSYKAELEHNNSTRLNEIEAELSDVSRRITDLYNKYH